MDVAWLRMTFTPWFFVRVPNGRVSSPNCIAPLSTRFDIGQDTKAASGSMSTTSTW